MLYTSTAESTTIGAKEKVDGVPRRNRRQACIVQQAYHRLAKILAMAKSYRIRGSLVAVSAFP